jgi:RNA polymerase sigma-70 factor (ECF subfamily)
MRKADLQEEGRENCPLMTDHSLLARYRKGEQDAATQLYLRYAARLQSWASSQTSSVFTARFDEEDVVQSVFRTLFRRVSDGLYDVPPGEELWQLLLVIALNKIRKLATFHRAQKRDVGKTLGSDELDLVSNRNQSHDENSLQILQRHIESQTS